MENLEKMVMNNVAQAISETLSKELVGYNKPVSNLCNRVIEKHTPLLEKYIGDGITQLLETEDFKETLKAELQSKLAKVLVARVGGELEKQVNQLKANPTTRAKITLAIDKIMNEME